MSDNNQNKKPNVTGSYPGVTGSYKKPTSDNNTTARYPFPDDTRQMDPVRRIPVSGDTIETDPVKKPVRNPMGDTTVSDPVRRIPVSGDTIVTDPVKAKQNSDGSRGAQGGKKSAPSKQQKKGFDWKEWFSRENVKGFLRQLRFYGLCLLVAILLTFGIVRISNDVFAFIKPDKSIVVSIPEGGSTKQIAKALDKAGVIDHPLVFELYCKLKKANGKFQFGDYTLNSNYSYDKIISSLKKSSVQAETVTFTVPEGTTQDELVTLLTAEKIVNITDLEHALNSYNFEEFEFVKDLPSRRCRLEGYLPAGEYEFAKGESAVSIVSKMLARFEETVLTEENKQLIKNTGKELDEIVIIASLVQAECSNPAEYKNVASVIANRLADPTGNYLRLTSPINYVLAQPKSIMATDDKKTDSKYNTYLHQGVTPGPICSPTIQAIEAVINPQSSPYYYFISDGDKVTLSETVEQHKAALEKASKTAKGTETIR